MTLTVYTNFATTNVGPGQTFDVQTDLIGPLEDLAFARVLIVEPVSGGVMCRGSTYLHGSHRVTVVNGYLETGPISEWPTVGGQNGLAVEAQARLYNAAGVQIDGPHTVSGFAWVDSGAWYLGMKESSSLLAVLQAVIRVFPAP